MIVKKQYKRIEDLNYNIITDTDSYKFSHWNQYPDGTSKMMSYFEARGGEFKESTLFGLQYFLHSFLSRKITMEDVYEAEALAEAHGEPFNFDGWKYIVNAYGCLPVVIRAIPEGTIVPTSNVLLTIECNDPNCFWIVSWIETMLVRLWCPSTVAISSREYKKILKQFLELSSDTPDLDIPFKLHDFGARGVATLEQSRLGGSAHLLSFMGTDTVEALRFSKHYYHCAMAGFSIPASEHSTVSMYGRKGEYAFFEKYVNNYLVRRTVPEGLPKLAACVSDTYDIFAAVREWCKPEMRNTIREANGTLVIRPDSGPPVDTLRKIFNILEEELGSAVTLNSKGYKVLPNELRVIQGDGIDREMMHDILDMLVNDLGWSATNIAFGSGGGLLQKFNRDTQKWAFKCCAALVDGKWVDVRKDPITDQGKRSKAGRLDLIKVNGEYKTIALPEGVVEHKDTVMQTVFYYGKILVNTTLDECRERISL